MGVVDDEDVTLHRVLTRLARKLVLGERDKRGAQFAHVEVLRLQWFEQFDVALVRESLELAVRRNVRSARISTAKSSAAAIGEQR